MIDRQEILEFAGEVGLDPNVVEKDYVLGWMLAGIAQHPQTRDTWVFKGGTCLKKCYFETYRFSEDLDFTLLDASHVDEAALRGLFVEIAEWIYSESGIEFPEDARLFEVYVNPRGKNSGHSRIGYRGPMRRPGDPPRVRFDLTDDERLVRGAELRHVHHPYSDEPEGGIEVLSYCFEEVFAEKLRALSERERPRDLYDVIHLHRHDADVNREVVLEILKSKCEFKGIAVPTLASLRASPQHAALRADWDQMLAHQLPELPPFDSFWNELPAVFDWLREAPVKVRPPAMGPGRHEIDPGWRAPAMASSWRAQGVTAPLEIIRFAAANHLCVELDYQDEGGRRGTRIIEPYSLRRTNAGDLLLYAVRSEDGQDRSYRVDRIVGARASKQAFTPRYAVELSVVEPLNAPRISRAAADPPRRATARPVARRSSGLGKMKYIFQCPYCAKKFERTKHDSVLNPHKTKDGYPCPGRVGHYVETKY